ncbi:MAG: sigma-70 family RNA polymerase sigma factor [Eubacteriales bacterium]|nr:sigma-70 family RNA polymerase sigma factor [Eubacteriales bacterium]
MEDTEIIELFWQRRPEALEQAGRKYGKLCTRVAKNILSSPEDAEECVNDAYLTLWNTIPPERPKALGAYITTLVRNASLSRYRAMRSKKRGGGQTEAALDELSECLAGSSDVARDFEAKALRQEIDRFLFTLSKDDRIIFLYRYWMLLSAPEIAEKFGWSTSKIGSSLYRTRSKLKAHLTKEEWI